MLFICYEKCSTCKKAQALLDELNCKYELRDIKKNNPKKEEIKKWQKLGNLKLKDFFNTSGLVYRSLNLKEKIKDMSEEEMLELLASDGMLVKRPLLITDNEVIIGFKKEKYLAIFDK